MAKKTIKKPKKGTVTGRQVVSILSSYDGELSRDTVEFGTYAQYRALREDPTISLGRGLLIGGILSGSWSVEANEGVPDAQIDAVKALLPLREQILQEAVGFGRVDFGWQGWEKIFAVQDGRIILERLKPLLADITVVLVDDKGNFLGYRQKAANTGFNVDVPIEKCLHIAFEVEGGDLYGMPLLENIRATQTMWDECNNGARRYDKKIAGSHFVVHYPPGTSQVSGETVDNSDIANTLLTALESSGSMALPSTTAEVLQELTGAEVAKAYQWNVTLLSDASARQPAFADRLKYLDVLKIRGLVLPERACLEGRYGTKADSGQHADLAITKMQQIDKKIAGDFNKQVVDQLLALNFGEAAVGMVRLVPAPLVDRQIAFLRDLYLKVSATTEGIDTEVLREKLNIPIMETEND